MLAYCFAFTDTINCSGYSVNSFVYIILPLLKVKLKRSRITFLTTLYCLSYIFASGQRCPLVEKVMFQQWRNK